jgi:hypothetical protein
MRYWDDVVNLEERADDALRGKTIATPKVRRFYHTLAQYHRNV